MEQKSTLAYKEQFNEREYLIMLEREQHGKSFYEIGKILGISHSRVSQIYWKAKGKQVLLYLRAIGDAIDKDDTKLMGGIYASKSDTANDILRSIRYSLTIKYGNTVNVAAYLENKYEDILMNYRNGEPPSHYKCPEINPDYYKQSTSSEAYYYSQISENDRLTHAIERKQEYEGQKLLCLYRTKLNEFELLVLREKGEKGKCYQEIAEQLHITNVLARNIYIAACTVQLHMKFAIIKEKTSKTFGELYNELLNQQISIKQYRKSFKYIDETYKDVLILSNEKQSDGE